MDTVTRNHGGGQKEGQDGCHRIRRKVRQVDGKRHPRGFDAPIACTRRGRYSQKNTSTLHADRHWQRGRLGGIEGNFNSTDKENEKVFNKYRVRSAALRS